MGLKRKHIFRVYCTLLFKFNIARDTIEGKEVFFRSVATTASVGYEYDSQDKRCSEKDTMNVKEELIRGLTSRPKYLPCWYRYDKQGSLYNDMCLEENRHYYLHRAEIEILKQHVQEMINEVPDCKLLVDMGSGNPVKSWYFIEALLEKQGCMTYVPVDISAEFLEEMSGSLRNHYDETLTICPFFGDYDGAINSLSETPDVKIILWFGSLQNLGRDEQIGKLRSLAKNMNESDRILLSMDITHNEQAILNAYLDTAGHGAKLHYNAVWRLNREYGSDIDVNKFELIGKFDKSTGPHQLSSFMARLRSIGEQIIVIPGLDLTIHLDDGEFLKLYENDGTSCKYTMEQIETLMSAGNQKIIRHSISQDSHVVFCCLAKL